MKTNSSPSPGGNTAKTSTFDVLNGYFARAKPALQCPPINDALRPVPPSTLPPSNAPSSLPATSSPSALAASPFVGATVSVSEKPSRFGSPRLPWWWTLIAIIASSAIAHLLTRPNNRPATSTLASSETPAPERYSLHRLQDGSGWIVALPNQRMYLLTQRPDGTLLMQTEKGLVPILPLTDPAR